jgi:hypothetical protein
MKRFGDAARCADRKTLQDLLVDGVSSQCRSPIDVVNEVNEGAYVDLATARVELIKALAEYQKFPIRTEVLRAGRQYARALEQNTVDANFAEAAKAANPLDRMLHLAAARIGQHLHSRDELVRAAEDVKHSRAPNIDWRLQDVEWHELLGIVGFIASIKRALK